MGLGDSNSGATRVRIGGATPVSDAADAARDFAAGHAIAGDDLSRLCVVVEEVFANLVEHGGVGPDQGVALTLSLDPHGVRLVMVDPGRPFDPRQAPTGGPRPTRGGGAGIDIVRRWATIVDYRISNGLNQLELLVPLRGGKSDGPPTRD